MDIKRSGSQLSTKGAAEYFTGTYVLTPCSRQTVPQGRVGASVTFEPGARTAWHTPIHWARSGICRCGRRCD